ncbi:hypothetical protein LINPERHAP2_LOCUS37666 [Linum perenne]
MSAGTSSGYLREEPRWRVAPTAVRRTCKTSDQRKDGSIGEAMARLRRRRGGDGAATATTWSRTVAGQTRWRRQDAGVVTAQRRRPKTGQKQSRSKNSNIKSQGEQLKDKYK